MRVVTAHVKHRLDAWWDAAVNTPHVSRFLSLASWTEPSRDPGDGWNALSWLSDDNSTWLSLRFDRDPRLEATMGLWCLHPNRSRRALACGRMLKRLPDLLRSKNVQVLHTVVHATNAESLALNRSRMGEPWGIKPEAAWDAALGRLVDAHCFRREIVGR